MKKKLLTLSDELYSLINQAAMAKYPQFPNRAGNAWIRETLETQAKKELSTCTKSN
jgi:hypothetical protein